MFKSRIRLVMLVSVFTMLFGVFFSTSSVQAQTTYIDADNLTLRSCSQTSYIVAMSIEWERADNERIWYGTTEPDGSQSFSVSSLNNRTSPLETWTIGYNFAPQDFPYTTSFRYAIIDTLNPTVEVGYFTIEVTCTGDNSGSVYMIVNTFTATAPTDGRVNSQHGDFDVAAYSMLDENGEYRLDVYCWDDATRLSNLAFSVTQADVAETELGGVIATSDCGATLYRLISDEIQLNVIYGNETYVMVDSDLNFRDAERRRE